MSNIKTRIYRIDGDELSVVSRYDEVSRLWIEDYVDLESIPRYTPKGRPWKSVTTMGCPYADPMYKDCGTCPWLVKERPSDLVGVCDHENFRRQIVN